MNLVTGKMNKKLENFLGNKGYCYARTEINESLFLILNLLSITLVQSYQNKMKL